MTNLDHIPNRLNVNYRASSHTSCTETYMAQFVTAMQQLPGRP